MKDLVYRNRADTILNSIRNTLSYSARTLTTSYEVDLVNSMKNTRKGQMFHEKKYSDSFSNELQSSSNKLTLVHCNSVSELAVILIKLR